MPGPTLTSTVPLWPCMHLPAHPSCTLMGQAQPGLPFSLLRHSSVSSSRKPSYCPASGVALPQGPQPSITPEYHQTPWPFPLFISFLPISESKDGLHPHAKHAAWVVRGVPGLRGLEEPDSSPFGCKSLPFSEPQFPHLYNGDEMGAAFWSVVRTPGGTHVSTHRSVS